MNIKDAMSINPSNLMEQQRKALLDHFDETIARVRAAIVTGDRGALGKLTFFSPAGDGYGLDSTCIDFGWAKDAPSQSQDIAWFAELVWERTPKKVSK